MVINVEVEGLKVFDDKIKKLGNLQNFWHSVGDYMQRRTIKECFDKEQSPDGVKWRQLSDARHNERSKRGSYKILSDTGELRRSVKYKAFSNYVIIGSNLKYSRIHQFGGKITVTPKMRKFLHYKGIHLKRSTSYVTIPPRPFLGVTMSDKRHIANMFTLYLRRTNV